MIRAFNNQDFEEQRTNQTFKNYAERMSKVNQIFAWITPLPFINGRCVRLYFVVWR